MSVVGIEATKRESSGTKNARAMRRDGKVPGNFYTAGKEAISLVFDTREMSYFLNHGHGLVDLKVEGEKSVRKCVLQEVQYDPVTEDVLHVDFLGVKMGEKMQLTVPLSFAGNPVGVRHGGLLQEVLRELNIECLPKDIPDVIEVDVSELEIGDSIHISDLSFPNITILNDPNDAVAMVIMPRVVVEAEEEEEAEIDGEEQDGEEESAEDEK